jgi:hypothetical protein
MLGLDLLRMEKRKLLFFGKEKYNCIGKIGLVAWVRRYMYRYYLYGLKKKLAHTV